MKKILVLGGLCALAVVCGCGDSGNLIAPKFLPPTTMSLSATSFNFGANVVNNEVASKVVEITDTGSAPLAIAPTVTGDSSFGMGYLRTCPVELPAGASCYLVIAYKPSVAGTHSATLHLNPVNVAAGTASTVVLTGTSAVLQAGTVTKTINPQVALYTITPPYPGKVSVHFGMLRYGQSTWSVQADGIDPVKIYVAGMLANRTYHMQAVVQLDNGAVATDIDHTFTTSSFPAAILPKIKVTLTGLGMPQPGIELMDQIEAGTVSNNQLHTGANTTNRLSVYATDLLGNVIWGYKIPDADRATAVQGVKLMQNGNVALILSPTPVTTGPVPNGVLCVMRVIDLAGNIVQQVSLTELNQRLQAAGFNITLSDFSHDVTMTPNGHFLLIASLFKQFASVAEETGPQNVLGDAIIDLDPNLQPVWVWNEFDHLDVNRHPYLYPDWTHTNAVVYSPTDGNILVSMRHENWVVKVNYQNGTGDGSILWTLGKGGDFTLQNGSVPTDWQYAQHAPAFVGENTAGTYLLTMMDNGDDRKFPSGVTCGTGSAPPCQYTTIPVFRIDESGKTATLVFHQIIPAAKYSLWGGDSHVEPNGDVEYDLTNEPNSSSEVDEVMSTSSAPLVWRLTETGANLYRSHRIPSLYPGVQWTGAEF